MKSLALLLVLFAGLAWGQDRDRISSQPYKVVDLGSPEELAWLKVRNPVHFEKIQKILHAHTLDQRGSIEKWMRVHLKAREVDYSTPYLASLPPQQRLSFVLDDTRYRVTIVIR